VVSEKKYGLVYEGSKEKKKKKKRENARLKSEAKTDCALQANGFIRKVDKWGVDWGGQKCSFGTHQQSRTSCWGREKPSLGLSPDHGANE